MAVVVDAAYRALLGGLAHHRRALIQTRPAVIGLCELKLVWEEVEPYSTVTILRYGRLGCFQVVWLQR